MAPFRDRRYKGKQKPRGLFPSSGALVLATSYSRTTYRRTTIGAAAFHCRVRNGNGWCHCAIITRVRNRYGGFAAFAATQARGRISGGRRLIQTPYNSISKEQSTIG